MTDIRVTARVVVELVTSAAVVASLVFVASEMRQNTAAIRASAIQGLSSTTSEYLNAFATDDHVPGLWARTQAGDLYATFTPEENSRLGFVYTSILRSYEARYLQAQLGVIDAAVLESMAGASTAFGHAWFIERWPRYVPLVSPGFASFMRERYRLP